MSENGTDEAPAVPLRQALARRLRGLAGLALDTVYPPVCAGCGVLLGSKASLCPACWAGLAFIERPYCEVLGTPFAHDLGAGFLSADAIANPPVFDRLRAVCLFEGAARNLVHGLKYRDRTELAPMMARWMARAPWWRACATPCRSP